MTSSLALSSAERKLYRGRAMNLKPAVMVGRSGATDTVIKAVDQALTQDGLIKIRLEAPDKPTRKQWLQTIAESTRSTVCGEVGHTASLYRPSQTKSQPETA
ncbi:YhbY family RNA-binding protein [Puniceicoccales bacterium CK1056]|uniref:YhbY family RNA-binding protein n=1 Tax=Oceanipulchritudo coccoides TaxID=2706888 RepID=A0A6B2M3V8_9BACT|nr:YhbY family RNA-binding protein [Oceanipulchritudo coccoides]NDV63443.1 YhbY family RNA-binding protein [Oceanipulchritudo coccoides]